MTTPKITAKKRESSTPMGASTAKVEPAAAKRAAAGLATPAARPLRETPEAKAKPKLIRDSFTIPKPEYAVLDGLKLRAAGLLRPIKKSELLRAGIFALNAMGDDAFLATLNSVPSLKTGRPKTNFPMGRP